MVCRCSEQPTPSSMTPPLSAPPRRPQDGLRRRRAQRPAPLHLGHPQRLPRHHPAGGAGPAIHAAGGKHSPPAAQSAWTRVHRRPPATSPPTCLPCRMHSHTAAFLGGREQGGAPDGGVCSHPPLAAHARPGCVRSPAPWQRGGGLSRLPRLASHCPSSMPLCLLLAHCACTYPCAPPPLLAPPFPSPSPI